VLVYLGKPARLLRTAADLSASGSWLPAGVVGVEEFNLLALRPCWSSAM
jgi:hypothetical protein